MKSLFNCLSFQLQFLAFIILSFQFSLAQDYAVENSCYNHLVEINAQWEKYPDTSPQGNIAFDSDEDRIKLHLELVCKYLRENTPSTSTKSQTKSRLMLVDALEEYAAAKVFPTNKYHSTRTPYFVDEENVHCAVGYLMAYSGHDDLVASISREHNYDYIEDIRTEGVSEWATNHGFTIDELKWIQPNYAASTNINSLSNGTNGPVNDIYVDNYQGRILFSGTFDSVDLVPCMNLGVYENDQLSCFEGGVPGTVNDVAITYNSINVFGAIENNGDVYPVAVYNGTWTYLSIPSRPGAICTAGNQGEWPYKMEVVISHDSIPDKQEVWCLTNSDVWEKKALVTGVILDIEASNFGRVYAGHFDTVVRYNASGIADSTISANNVVIKGQYTSTWSGLGSEVSDTVKTVKSIGSAIYFGGTCSSTLGNSAVCITRYLNGTLQPLVLRENFSNTGDCSINSIAYEYSSSELLFGGDFNISPMMGNYGTNLASYNLVYNQIEALAILDAPVEGLNYYDNSLYLGGHFLTNQSTQNLNHLGRISSVVGLEEPTPESSLVISPNPFIDEITITGAQPGDQYMIVNMSGQILEQGVLEGNTIANLNHLTKGVYLLKLTSLTGESTHQLVK